MRINAGDYKFRKIELPADIRPTTEKVREAICSMVMPSIPEANVPDLFAGIRGVGIGTAFPWGGSLSIQ